MYDLNQIKQRINCIDYLSSQGYPVPRNGRMVSPIRPDASNPTSFRVSEDRWFDYGSGEGGDVIDLCARLQFQGDLGQAIRHLARSLGLYSQDYDRTSSWREDIQNLCNRTAYYQTQLTASDYEYLAARGFDRSAVSRLKIGRVTDGHLRGRLFLPYLKNGYVCYYATRAMEGGTYPDSKYMKASLKECASYENVPWGLWTLTRPSDTLVISEGYFDAASWENEGYAVLSPITGRFSASQWPTVIEACQAFQRVLIIFDNDPVSHAGAKFTESTAEVLFRYHIPFVVATTPDGIKDVNDYYAGGGDLSKLVDSAIDGLEFLAKRCKTAVQLKDFILSIKRFTEPVRIASVLSKLQAEELFSPMEIREIKKAAEKPPSESQIADEIINDHHIIYVDQVGFYEWNGQIWRRQPDSIIRNYADLAYGKMFSTAQRIGNACSLLKARSVSSVQFNRAPVITFQNGTLEINTGRFRQSSETDYCSIIMDYAYDPNATCPAWESFISDVTNGDPKRMEILQFLAGYVLFPDCPHQKVFLLIGQEGNGKSVYLDVLQRVFGIDNVSHVEPSGLCQDFQRIRIKDSLLNIGTDINSNFSNGEIREWLLKIADGTVIQACYKGLNYVDFIPRAKLVYACNELPSADIINGLKRRMLFVRFPCSYVDFPDPSDPLQRQRDIHLTDRLTQELPGIFLWAYAGYRDLNKYGYFTEADEQRDYMTQFRIQSDPVIAFCEDFKRFGELTRDDIYEAYRTWCMDTQHRPLARERFLPRFRTVMGKRILKEHQVRRSGNVVRVFDIAEPEDEPDVVDYAAQLALNSPTGVNSDS